MAIADIDLQTQLILSSLGDKFIAGCVVIAVAMVLSAVISRKR